jgi:hypothetical protein
MKLDADFVADHDCVGRQWMPSIQRMFLDLVCSLIGHSLWRVTNSVRVISGGSLTHQASYCRRCFKGGYVQGDYAKQN